jgi:hypothetical protein
MAQTEAQKRAKAKYNEKVIKLTIEFYPQDAELLQKVNEQTNKQGYIKQLIKNDLKKEQGI